MIQDIFPHKLDNSYKNHKVRPDDNIVIFIDKSVAVVRKSKTDISFPKYEQLKNRLTAGSKLRYLFSVDENAYMLLTNAEEEKLPNEIEFLPLAEVRKMKYGFFKEMYFLICTAWHLYTWYDDNRFCARCKRDLLHGENERELICPDCGKTVYPRISPAVIIGVTDGDRIIMSKYAGRTYKGYALLSGFVEIGETLEQAVGREVMEEVGVKVKNIRYYKSQPGGIDGNILAGFFCELDGDDALTVDTSELAMAKWFKRDEIPVEDDGYSLTFEMIGYFKNNELRGI